ncbi:MAG: hypothetical protein WBB28_19225 [Crinalium sp.]|uniref:PIN domain-containing protein n=1 Tax=Crinalium epipsammum PCC 9333 TaxID=1173022 RepID=K9VTV9_9CYAN|nr:hypothetical protein [Crinalium epipsammum]AFZ11513.1 hypothetical protein Cri9333_0563 [Crinalium epipsammum PCC 9333]
MSNVVSILEPRNVTHVVVEQLPNRSNLRARYGLHPRTFYEWHTFLEIATPPKNGYFKLQDVILLDEFWIAQKVFMFSQDDFKNAVILTKDGSFENLVAQYTRIPLIDYLKKSSQFSQHPVVLDTIDRINEATTEAL